MLINEDSCNFNLNNEYDYSLSTIKLKTIRNKCSEIFKIKKMKKEPHSGNAVNVANFESILGYCIAMGAKYNPTNQTLAIGNLTIKLNLAKAQMSLVNSTFTDYNKVRNLRKAEYKFLKTLCTRIINALIACGASDETIAKARTINRKIQGGRAKKVVSPVVGKTDVETADVAHEILANEAIQKSTIEEIKKISVSQQGFDSNETNFSKLLALLNTEPLYVPNEEDLTIEALTIKETALKDTNSAVKLETPLYTNSLTSRDVVLYESKKGVVDTALLIKAYALSVLDAKNADYKKINHIHFKTF